MAKKRTMHIKLRDLWDSVLQCGPVTVQFQEKTKKHGRRAKVVSHRHDIRHKTQVVAARSK